MMEYYSAIKMRESRTHATTWMNLKNPGLNEGSQAQKTTYCVVAFI